VRERGAPVRRPATQASDTPEEAMATMAMNRAGVPVTAIEGRGPRARREAWRWTKLVLGLSTYGLTISLMLRSGLGLGP
jgi:hypothetical protein